METFLSDLGLREYYPRFAAQGVETVDDLSRERKLDDLLETVGMDCNPGHARKLKNALLDRGGAPSRPPPSAAPTSGRANKKKRKADAALAAASADPAEAIRAAMAAARARGGGGDARPTPRAPTAAAAPTSDPSVSAANRLDVADAAELETIVDHHRRGDPLALLGLPPAPVDLYGKVDWATHPVSRMGEVMMRAKVMALRADPERCSHPLAAAARDAVNAAVESLTDRDARKDALTRAVRRRVEEMRRDGVGDVAGGYVSSTGVHYAAGAAASETANYKPDGDAHGPATNPAAGMKHPPASRDAPSVADGADVGAGAGGGLGLGFGSGDADGPGARPAAKEAANGAAKEAAKEAANGAAGDAALEARLKLAKRRGPTFM